MKGFGTMNIQFINRESQIIYSDNYIEIGMNYRRFLDIIFRNSNGNIIDIKQIPLTQINTKCIRGICLSIDYDQTHIANRIRISDTHNIHIFDIYGDYTGDYKKSYRKFTPKINSGEMICRDVGTNNILITNRRVIVNNECVYQVPPNDLIGILNAKRISQTEFVIVTSANFVWFRIKPDIIRRNPNTSLNNCSASDLVIYERLMFGRADIYYDPFFITSAGKWVAIAVGMKVYAIQLTTKNGPLLKGIINYDKSSVDERLKKIILHGNIRQSMDSFKNHLITLTDGGLLSINGAPPVDIRCIQHIAFRKNTLDIFTNNFTAEPSIIYDAQCE